MDPKQILDIVHPCKKLEQLGGNATFGILKLGNNAKIQQESAKLNIIKCQKKSHNPKNSYKEYKWGLVL